MPDAMELSIAEEKLRPAAIVLSAVFLRTKKAPSTTICSQIFETPKKTTMTGFKGEMTHFETFIAAASRLQLTYFMTETSF